MQIVERFENIISVINLVNFEMRTKHNLVTITNDYRMFVVINNFKMTSVFDIDFNFNKTFISRINHFQIVELLIIQSIKNSLISFSRQFLQTINNFII